jgi:hypothetical protein
VLGAANVGTITTLDILDQLFARSSICVVKINPVNDYLGPFYAAPMRRGERRSFPAEGDRDHAGGIDDLHSRPTRRVTDGSLVRVEP